ncbi:MAG: ATP-binding cassette domain-containing protein [Chromatiaceae bacterium]|jgi:Fe-S cluster assembly ATP-binding protein|nr:ATP-binding cassette domain-containing protein [Chromatiaceae bacterium]
MTRPAALLELTGLSLTLGGRRVLDGIDLAVCEGELHALLGPNGAGKSSLAYALMGCAGYQPQAGEVRFVGQDIAGRAIHERARLGLALAWQEPARFEGLSVRDFLGLGAGEADPAECLHRVGLAPEDYLDRALDKTLSGGERKRIELAGVLARKPRLAILDEPTAGIDFLSHEEIATVIQAMRRHGAVLLITHEESLAGGADRASQLCGGRIVFRGAPAEVIAHYKTRGCRRCDGEICGL